MNAIPVSGKNRHPVDELADIRARIKDLKAREDELKSEISEAMGDADSLGGDEFIAMQKLSTRKGSIDPEMIKRRFGPVDIDELRKPDATVMSITVERREVEVA